MKTIFKSSAIIITLMLIALSCNNSEPFPKEWKDEYKAECVKEASVSLSNKQAVEFCNCTLEKIIKDYSSGKVADEVISGWTEEITNEDGH